MGGAPNLVARLGGLTRTGPASAIIVIERFAALQAVRRAILRVPSALVADVIDDPRQVPRPEVDDTMARLRGKDLAIHDLVVDVMRACALESPDPIADDQCRWDRCDEVDVIVASADLVEVCARCLYHLAAQVAMEMSFDLVLQDRVAALNVPDDVKVDSAIGR